MEERPIFPTHPEEEEDEDEESSKQPKKKLPSLLELIAKDDAVEQTDYSSSAQPLFKIFERDKPDEADSLAQSTDTQAEDEPGADNQIKETELTPLEEDAINRAIATQHLSNPVVEGQPAEPVIEFLEMVKDGTEPETAFGATKVVHQLEQTEIESGKSVDPPSRPEAALSAPLSEETPLLKSKNQKRPEKPQITPTATMLSRVISRHRSQPNLANNEPSKNERGGDLARPSTGESALEAKVAAIEERLISKETQLQRMSRAKSAAETSKAAPRSHERLQPGLSESRLDLNKPEQRATRIGKMLVSQERAQSQRPSPEQRLSRSDALDVPPSPDSVKTMRRAELLKLSNAISIEGASLKHMFENNLFDEAALRRLIEAHLKGATLAPLLRREILTRQSDFERDPAMRARNLAQQGTTDILFDEMLDATALGDGGHNIVKPRPKPQEPAALNLAQGLPTLQQKTPKRVSLASALLSLVIILLILLILFFALR